MRVLLVSQEYPPETGWGGIGTYAGIIAPALARSGAEVHVLSVVPGQERRSVVRDGVHVHRAPLTRPRGVGRISRLPETWSRLSLAWGVWREYRRLEIGYDVVECPEWGAEGLVLSHRGRVPLVVRLHSGAAQVFPYLGNFATDHRLAARLEDHVVRRADVVTGTRAQIATISERLALSDRRLRAITYPVRAPTRRPPLPDHPRILMAGRFERRKGPETLVRSLPDVLRVLPRARLALVGRDTSEPGKHSYAAWLGDLARGLGVAHALEIHERWGSEIVTEELARSTVCAVPSRWESFGYVAAEAGALGRPVVASRIPALADVVEDGVTGRLVDAEDPRAWARALVEILAHPHRAREMGDRAARRMATVCDPAHIAEVTLRAYELAIGHSVRDTAPAPTRAPTPSDPWH